MTRTAIVGAACFLCCTFAFAGETATFTGWFADQQCATSRAKTGTFTPTNPDCAEECIRKGGKTALISEKDKAVYVIANPELAKEHFAEHVQVSGTLDRKTGVLQISSVKDLGDYQGPACARPRKK